MARENSKGLSETSRNGLIWLERLQRTPNGNQIKS